MNATTLKARFASNLRRVRKRAGLSQETLGFRSELHPTEISQLERGGRIPRVDTLVKLAIGLDADPCELLDGMTWAPREPRHRRIGQ